MKQIKRTCLASLCAAAFLAASSLSAADSKTYQVTGPVLEVTPTTITVQKGDDKWEIARTSKTKVTGDLKVGAKVTIQYTMAATEVEVKEAKAKKK
jgi:LysM repeat protein